MKRSVSCNPTHDYTDESVPVKGAHTISILENELDSLLRPQQLLWPPEHTQPPPCISALNKIPHSEVGLGYMVKIIISINKDIPTSVNMTIWQTYAQSHNSHT